MVPGGQYTEAGGRYTAALPIGGDLVRMTRNSRELLRSPRGVLSRARQVRRRSLALSRALSIREKALGSDHADVAASLDTEARSTRGRASMKQHWRWHSGRCRSVKRVQRRPPGRCGEPGYAGADVRQIREVRHGPGSFATALSIREKAFGPEHIDVATSLNTRATLLFGAGEYARGLPLTERSLAIREKLPDLVIPSWPSVLTTSGAFMARLVRQSKVCRWHSVAWAIQEKVLGRRGTFGVAENLAILAKLRAGTNQPAQALPLAQRALTIAEKALRPDQTDVAYCRYVLAETYQATGRFPQTLWL